jgi:hypothetical protein
MAAIWVLVRLIEPMPPKLALIALWIWTAVLFFFTDEAKGP